MNDHIPCCEKSWRELAEIVRTSIITINEKSGGRHSQSRFDGSVTSAKQPRLFMFAPHLPQQPPAPTAKPGVHGWLSELQNPGPLLTTPWEEDKAGDEAGRSCLLTCLFQFRVKSLSQKVPDFLYLLLSRAWSHVALCVCVCILRHKQFSNTSWVPCSMLQVDSLRCHKSRVQSCKVASPLLQKPMTDPCWHEILTAAGDLSVPKHTPHLELS